jgi:hypothetical protein
MLGDAIRTMKLDRRLASRRGWIGEADLARALNELPDVKEKAAEPAPPPEPAPEPPPGS